VAVKLELLIELDSKGAVKGVQSLNSEIDKLDGATKKADTSGKGLMGSIFGQVTAANLATKAILGLTNFVKDSALAFMDSEKQQARMNVVLRRNSEDVDAANKKIGEFSDGMQYLTGIDNDQIKSLELLARQYEIQDGKIDGAIKGAIGLTEIGGDLESNLKALANAYNGNWSMLTKLIPELRTAKTESERLDILNRKMAEGFEMTTEAMKTAAGSAAVLKNWWDDLKESTGGFIVNAARVADYFQGMRGAMANYAREQIADQEKLNQELDDSIALVDKAIEQQRTAAGWNSKGTPEQLGFIDIESDLSTGYLADTKAAMDFQKVLDDLNEKQKKRVEIEKTLAEVLDDRWTAFNKTYEEDKAYSAFLTAKLGPAIESYSDAWGEGIDITKMAAEGDEELNAALQKLADNEMLDDGQQKAAKVVESWQEIEAQFQQVERAIGFIDDMFSALGINATGITSQIQSALGAVSSYSAGMASLSKEGGSLTDKLTGVTSIIGAVSAAIGIAASIIKAFSGDGIGEALDRENQWMKLNEKLEEQLRDLAKETGSVHEATSIMLDEIINQTDITVDNFGQYAQRIREILSELDRGELTLSETQNEIGDSFEALISKAEELGTTGSASLLTLFDDLASRGIQVAEITEYINQQMTAGLTGYKAYMEGDFSDATIGVFEEMLAYEKKVGENQTLIDGIEGITDALVGMSNASRLTEGEFDNFEKAGRDAYDALIAKGFTEKESLIELAPMLSRLVFLQNEYGLAIDAETQALIDKAKAEGVNLDQYKSQEEIFSDMSDALNQLVEIFRSAFPSAIDATTDAFSRLNGESGKFNPDTTYTGGKGGADVQAASGFYSPRLSQDTLIQAHKGEEVRVVPAGQNASGGGDGITNLTIEIRGPGVTPIDVAEAARIAWRGNVRGFRSLLGGH
jgi:hypothetical protein